MGGESDGDTKREELSLVKFNIPIPNLPGLSIETELKAIAEAEADGKFKFEIFSTYLFEVGAKLSNGELEEINNFEELDKLKPDFLGEATLESKAGLELTIQPQLYSVVFSELTGFTVLGLEASLKQKGIDFTEFEIRFEFEPIEIFDGFIGTPIRLDNKEKVIEIKMEPGNFTEMHIGQTKKITVIGVFENNLTRKRKEVDTTRETNLKSSKTGLISVS